ncbi:F0F1 ATP synthase subunit B [Kushneria indalinina]|uniref:ATP synthase subunit b n=1 Tax=Kushneria indalinina DSM 14324 TaxID=1122140 RepID=A0A3D9DWE5_9GAMM|nr:F0F1 ATP synthase subunit B [Kushneria indalinina]REC95098.1 ATP synthase F0 subcomplex B subunit [Kushneria indalinina DSM 14324]
MNINMTLIGQMIAFAIFVWFCMKYVWPPITQALTERQQRIQDGLEEADRARAELHKANEQAEETLRESREEAARILDNTRARANQMIEEARNDARAEGERMIANARSEIDSEIQQAKSELRAQVATLAIQGAERILESSIDEKKHREMVDRLAEEL